MTFLHSHNRHRCRPAAGGRNGAVHGIVWHFLASSILGSTCRVLMAAPAGWPAVAELHCPTARLDNALGHFLALAHSFTFCSRQGGSMAAAHHIVGHMDAAGQTHA